jgi:hypothetical protein
LRARQFFGFGFFFQIGNIKTEGIVLTTACGFRERERERAAEEDMLTALEGTLWPFVVLLFFSWAN